MKNNNVNVKVATFREAFDKFLSYCDHSLSLQAVSSFAQLKERKLIRFDNEGESWHGNHYHSSSYVEMIMVEEPCIFYIVKFHYHENSDNSHSSTETHVFVIN